MPLAMDVGFDPDDIVLDGDPASPVERGTAAPTFRPMSIVAKRSPNSALLSSCTNGRPRPTGAKSRI